MLYRYNHFIVTLSVMQQLFYEITKIIFSENYRPGIKPAAPVVVLFPRAPVDVSRDRQAGDSAANHDVQAELR